MSNLICSIALALSLAWHQQAQTSVQQKTSTPSNTPQLHTMLSDDTCRNRVNKLITLHRGDQVEVYRSIAPSDPATKRLPAHSPLSMKVNVSYVRAATGSNSGEYCWVSTVNIH